MGDPCRKYVRRRPTLPHSDPCSTIGAERLSFRVRNGAGRFPFAMAAETLWRYIGVAGPWQGQQLDSRPYLGNRTVDACIHRAKLEEVAVCGQVLGLLVPVSYNGYPSSTSGLSTRWSRRGPYQVNPVGDLILKRASRLDAFSLSLIHI